MDDGLQLIIDNHLRKNSINSLLVVSFTFKEQMEDSPAFTLGGRITLDQILDLPIGAIFVSEGLCRILNDAQLEFVVLHELGHILKNHWAANLLILFAKDLIVKELASRLRISIEAAKNIVGLAKIFLPSIGVEAGRIEERIMAQNELEADRYAVEHQGGGEPAISALQKLSVGNVSAPTHVTMDGSFISPVITFERRIDAIKNLILP